MKNTRGVMGRLWSVGLLAMLMIQVNGQAGFKTKQCSIQLDATGKLASIKSIATQREYLVATEAHSLLSIKKDGLILASEKATWKPKTAELVLQYPGAMEATIKVQQNDQYLSFELKQLSQPEQVELVIWGPYSTSIADTIGEVVGVVRSKEFAFGIQALNIKTLGGYPNADNDVEPSYDVFDKGNKIDVVANDLDKQLFRGDVARPTEFGSVLQAYCRNRNKDRVIENWGHEHYLAPAFKSDGGVIGSKIALFGVAVPAVLPTLSQIEIKEGLPHPMLDGVWSKEAVRASESYLIMDFGVNNLPDAMALTQQAGLRYLYHSGPFENWGQFKLDPKAFPQNWASMKQCVDLAREKGLRLGVHTLSNFITPNDPYVTPVPNPGLAKVGYARLTAAIDSSATEIGISDTLFFKQFKNNTLKSVVVGSEIIRYTDVSSAAPWKLTGCQRGAFGTHASAHNQDDSIGKLMDHPYKVFLTDYSLQEEMAQTLARLFNETGLMQISFDGLEGCWSTGMGQYARQLFTKTWFDNLKPELKGKVINDASMPGHYFWHIYTRMNWGEPWYAGFRESQLQLRLKNQQFFRRNLMPSMLGWFSVRPETSVEDIEWMLAMGAGYNAGFGLSTSLETLSRHGKKDDILAAIKLWEAARLGGLFNDKQKEKMRSLTNEFHLEATNNGGYQLTPVFTAHFKHQQKLKQPGEPVYSDFTFENPSAAQPVSFIISLAPGKEFDPEVVFENPSLIINQQDALVLPVSLKKGQTLQCDGTSVKLYDKQWKLLQTITLPKNLPTLNSGKNDIVFDGHYSGEDGADVKLELRANGTPETILPKAK